MSRTYSHFDYACAVWYPNLNKKYKNKLQVLQNKCLRFCLHFDSREHIETEHFDKIKWLPIDQIFKHLFLWQICTYLFTIDRFYYFQVCRL